MTAQDLLKTLHERNVTLIPHADGVLHYKGSKRTLTPELLADIRQHKAGLYALVEAEAQRVVMQTVEESPPLASGGNGAETHPDLLPCAVCHGTLRWNHADIWRCVACWPREAFSRKEDV